MRGKVYSYQTKSKGVLWGFIHDAPMSTKKRNQIRKTGYTTQREASRAMRKSITDYEAGKVELNKDLTCSDVIKLFLEYAKNEGRYAKGTISNYEGYYRNHLTMFHDMPVNKLTKVLIKDWHRELYNSGASDHVYNGCLKLLKASFYYAVDDLEVLTVNPFRKMEEIKIPRKHRHRFTTSEVSELIDTCFKVLPEYYCIFVLSVLTGMREGEYSAIKTTDILKIGKIVVDKQITWGEYKEKPKTQASLREVDISEQVMSIINWHIKTFKIKDGDFLFKADKGGKLYAKWVQRKFQKLLIACGYEPNLLRVHDLRGQYIDIMHFLGASLVHLSKQVGHSNPKVTANVYTEILDELPKQVNKKLDKLIFSK